MSAGNLESAEGPTKTSDNMLCANIIVMVGRNKTSVPVKKDDTCGRSDESGGTVIQRSGINREDGIL